ncbi:hypothetical protein I3760_16G060600 [Carya illinoinensis]|nr:hypothetical protein I3760_16G060600 [Carya illinoinensis]
MKTELTIKSNGFFTDPWSSFLFFFPSHFEHLSSVHAPSPLPKPTASPGETNAIPTAINQPCAFIVAVLYSLQHFRPAGDTLRRSWCTWGRWSIIKKTHHHHCLHPSHRCPYDYHYIRSHHGSSDEVLQAIPATLLSAKAPTEGILLFNFWINIVY